MQLSDQASERRVVDVHALEAFADLLFALDSGEAATGFYGRLCEATCRLAAMDRAGHIRGFFCGTDATEVDKLRQAVKRLHG